MSRRSWTLDLTPALAGARGALAPLSTPTIILVRHGRPALDRSRRLSWREYRTWWEAYGRSGLAEGERPPEALKALAGEADLILASTLPRAIETAMALVPPGTNIPQSDLYVEAPLPAPPIPLVRLKPGMWGVISRIAWWLGFSARGESRAEAKERARKASDALAALAETHGLVMLCGHGWFNRIIRGVMRARGWNCSHDGGDGYWSWRKLERR